MAQAENSGYEAYIPLEYRRYRNGKSRSRAAKHVTAIPRVVFIKAPDKINALYFSTECASFKHSKGCLHDASGTVYTISDWQMGRFKAMIDENNEAAMKRAANQPAGKAKRAKLRSFDELRAYFDKTAQLEAAE